MAAAQSNGRFARLRERLHRPHPRREVAIVGMLGLAVIVGLGSLGAAWVLYRNDHDWTAVASVNGHPISREALRSRMAVLSFLGQERVEFIGERTVAGDITSNEQTALATAAQAPLANLVNAARESLIDEELLRQLTSRDGVATPPPADPWAEATRYASGDIAYTITYVRFGLPASPSALTPPAGDWPAASALNVQAATDRLTGELSKGTAVTVIVAGLREAGWQVVGEDVAVSSTGVPADSSIELDPSIAAGSLRAGANGVVGPTTDLYGRVSAGRVINTPDTSHVQRMIRSGADKAKVDAAALQSWADGRALQRAANSHLLADWSAEGVAQAHFRALVIGAAPDSSGGAGPWVELSGLFLDRLAAIVPGSIVGAPAGLDLHPDALTRTLGSLDTGVRVKLWRALVTAANAGIGPGSERSGEIGYVTKDGLIPALGTAAYDAKVKTGDILGPIVTSSGPELFLVESRYNGSLDDRAKAALSQVRSDSSPDPATYTSQFSPSDLALATDAGWRGRAEFSATEPASSALFDSPTGALSDPFVLDGKLVLALVDQRATAVPDPRMLDRLTLDGYDAWFAGELAKATVSRNETPLPELAPSAAPSSTSSSSAPAPSLPEVEAPNLPTNPGAPAPTPVQTDAFGLPALP